MPNIIPRLVLRHTQFNSKLPQHSLMQFLIVSDEFNRNLYTVFRENDNEVSFPTSDHGIKGDQ